MATLDTRGLYTGRGFQWKWRLHMTELFDAECAAYDLACAHNFDGPAMAAYEKAKAEHDRQLAIYDARVAAYEEPDPHDGENFMGMR